MDRDDPISQFFPNQEDVDLYAVLSLTSSATSNEIKKAYRQLALVNHPDKHANSSEEARAEASKKFQQIGFVYTVLSDDKRRSRYDKTGRTDEGLELHAGEEGWEAYFGEMFDSVTKGKLDEMKKEYQGSPEEVEDIKQAYTNSDSTIGEIMSRIPHATLEDELRFITLIERLIKDGELPKSKSWDRSIRDEKTKLVRKKQAEREAAEAEEMARELGVWDEFYGSGKTGKRKAKGKQSADRGGNDNDDDDFSALQAIMLRKKRDTGALLDSLAAKYVDAEPKERPGRGKKRVNDCEESRASGKKAKPVPMPPDIDNEEFKILQEKLFVNKAARGGSLTNAGGEDAPKPKKGRKAKT